MRTLFKYAKILPVIALGVPIIMSPILMLMIIGVILYVRSEKLNYLPPWMKTVVSFIMALLLFRIAGCFDRVFCNYYITLPTALLLAFVTHMGKRLFDGYKKKRCQDTNQEQTTVDAEYWNPDTNKWER